MDDRPGEFDLFLSHGTPDKPWVRALADELERLGLQVFLDERELEPGENWVVELDKALAGSRYLVLILSKTSTPRPWVIQEWTAFMAASGPLGRVIPVKIDAVETPTILAATQAVDGLHRNAARVAAELHGCVGDPAALGTDDARRLYVGRDLVFSLRWEGKRLQQVAFDGQVRDVPLPWQGDERFGVAWLNWQTLCAKPDPTKAERKELFAHAKTLGKALFSLLFDESGVERLKHLIAPGKNWRPVVTIRTDNDFLLSLPWELLYFDSSFLVRDQRIDVVRTTAGEVAGTTLLREPADRFDLVVNVSAPAGSSLSYEAESYRITLALAGRCEVTPTELGTVTDLIETVLRTAPRGVHFSGHGGPGTLQFEDDEGREDTVPIGRLLDELRASVPDEQGLPSFFYLASCHGNSPGRAEEGEAGSMSSAAQLHRAGVTQVVGYYGPIEDELSTRAEEALYGAIAEGRDTRYAVRQARRALARGPVGGGAAVAEARPSAEDAAPFAWAQLVLYHRGPEFPLSTGDPAVAAPLSQELRRTFDGFGSRRVLRTGFVGRRTALHDIRRRIRQGERVFVFQGLGGLGKSTLAEQVLPMLTEDANLRFTLWCQETEADEDQGTALVAQLLSHCRGLFGPDWEGVVQHVDQLAREPAERFIYFLHAAAQNAPRLVLYLDNLESLLVGPDDEDAEDSFGAWASPDLQAIWAGASQLARDSDSLYLVASTRYRHKDYADAQISVPPLPTDALFRLTAWFPALRRLSVNTRARLVARLDGHPRAVEYANDLVHAALRKWDASHGEWAPSPRPDEATLKREWVEIVGPALPQVEERLRDNLLLAAIWERVLAEDERRMLYRMTVLRRPAKWELLEILGEEHEPKDAASATATRLLDTSLLERMDLSVNLPSGVTGREAFYALHPATRKFVESAFAEAPDLRFATHLRLGKFLEGESKRSPYIETSIEAGYHLLKAGRYDSANELLGPAAVWLRHRGRVREGLDLLKPFAAEETLTRMDPALVCKLLGTMGLFHVALGQVKKAIDYYERALVIAREIGDRQGEGNVLGNLGNAYARLGQAEKAIGFHEQALVISREIGDRRGESSDLGNLGNAYARLGQVEKATQHHEQALVISREVGDRRGEGGDLGNLGLCYASLGQVEKAIECYEQALSISREIGNRQGEGNVLGNLGNAYASQGQVENAIGAYEQALVIAREIGDRHGEGNHLGNLGNAYARLGQVEKAIGYHEQALVISREVGDRHGEGSDLGNLGNDYARLGQVEKAIGYYEQALAISREVGDRHGESSNLGNLGNAYFRLEQIERAIGYYEQALVIFREIGNRHGESSNLGNLGNAYARLGKVEKAIGCYEQALEIGQEIHAPAVIDNATSALQRLRSEPGDGGG